MSRTEYFGLSPAGCSLALFGELLELIGERWPDAAVISGTGDPNLPEVQRATLAAGGYVVRVEVE